MVTDAPAQAFSSCAHGLPRCGDSACMAGWAMRRHVCSALRECCALAPDMHALACHAELRCVQHEEQGLAPA